MNLIHFFRSNFVGELVERVEKENFQISARYNLLKKLVSMSNLGTLFQMKTSETTYVYMFILITFNFHTFLDKITT